MINDDNTLKPMNDESNVLSLEPILKSLDNLWRKNKTDNHKSETNITSRIIFCTQILIQKVLWQVNLGKLL